MAKNGGTGTRKAKVEMVVMVVLALAATGALGRNEPFILGADISWLPQREAEGRTFHDQGVQKDAIQILKEHKLNYIRLRIFHNPRAQGGYSSRGYCDLEQTKAMAKRIKSAGMRFLLDFHYSDTWADPEAQRKPAAWSELAFAPLTDSLRNHTRAVLQALKDQGTPPDMVQIGNEINPGIMLPDGSSSNWNQLAALLGAGIAATRETIPTAKVMLHIASGGDNQTSRWFMDNAIAKGLRFDVFGLSCYTEWHGQPPGWESNFKDLAARYPNHHFIIAEYSHEKRPANDIVFNLPDERGLGTFIWEPLEWMEKVFDSGSGGRWNSNALLDLYPVMSKDYGNDNFTSAARDGGILRGNRNGSRLRILRADGGILLLQGPEDGRTAGPHNLLGRSLSSSVNALAPGLR